MPTHSSTTTVHGLITPASRHVADLIKHATDPAAHEADRTRAAVEIAGLIRHHGMAVVDAAALRRLIARVDGKTQASDDDAGGAERRIRARRSGQCRVCGAGIEPGDDILWRKGAGVRHPDCR